MNLISSPSVGLAGSVIVIGADPVSANNLSPADAVVPLLCTIQGLPYLVSTNVLVIKS